ncbi:MAG: hypothetical protein KGM18_00005 [Sphingomonadales bacterium]|nr:hypothetical protein [Sphingomonadales bacterium]
MSDQAAEPTPYAMLGGEAVNRRPKWTHYRRAKGNHLSVWRWLMGGAPFALAAT